jgi:hypothetical protein
VLAAVVFVAVGVALAVAFGVAVAVASAVAVAVALAEADVEVVAFFVATGFALCVEVVEVVATACEVAEVDEAGATVSVPEPIAAPPAILISLLADSCGGVIANTAPRPPTVPVAISSARFISFPRFVYPLEWINTRIKA